jgi:hypothetical protein
VARTALIVGCATNVWDDVKEAQELVKFDAIYCVKLAGVHWPTEFNVWATLHPEWMDSYEADRLKLGLPNGYEIVAPLSTEVGMHGAKGHIARRISYRWPGMTSSASSGIYAVKVALDDGFSSVVLAGIPMQQEANHFARGKPWLQRDCFLPGFEKATPFMLGRVKSMSGLTREVLGAPSPEWLAQS